MITTSRGGPPRCDVYRRIIRRARTGKLIDDCLVDDVPDEVLDRYLRVPEDIRVELMLHGSTKLFEDKGVDVAEIYSQPRIAQEAAMRNYDGVKLTPGWSLDLTRDDPITKAPWDFSKREVRERAKKLIRDTEPLLVIGSPPCTMFSQMQNISKGRREEEEFNRKLYIAKEHVKFCLEVYMIQMRAGRYFMHEHPHTASSWDMPEVLQLAAEYGVDMTTCDMCAFGLTVKDPHGEALAEKRTRIMSNSPEILKRVSLQCSNRAAPP